MRLARGTPAWILLPWALGGALGMVEWRLAWGLPLRGTALFALLVGLFLLTFFRDPHRKPAPGVVSPADGVVLNIEQTTDRLKFVVFMNPFNVHVNRTPLAGRVIDQIHHTGSYRPAYSGGASQNERLVTRLETPLGEVVVTQLAGVLVRRIVSYVSPGQELAPGERLGLIRFGSRVEVNLPAQGLTVAVNQGQKVKAALTTLAHLPSAATPAGESP